MRWSLLVLLPFASWLFSASVILGASLGLMKRLREWHHGYLGILMMLMGMVWWVLAPSPWALVLMAAGGLILSDDAYQHDRQSNGDPTYLSPLHRAFGWFYARLRWLRALTEWLDVRFGRSSAPYTLRANRAFLGHL